MSLGVVVPAAALEAIRAVTGCQIDTRPTPTVGGFSNISFGTTIDGQSVVAKVASLAEKRDDLRREARILSLLDLPSDTQIPVPKVRWHGDHDEWTVTLLDTVPGEHGISAMSTHGVVHGKVWATMMARLLQAIQIAAPQPVRDWDLDLPRRLDLLHDLEGIPADVERGLHNSLAMEYQNRGVSLVHGDFGLHNVLFQFAADPPTSKHAGALPKAPGARVGALLDWEFAGWGSPLMDVAWFWWTLQFREGYARKLWTPFVEAYGRAGLQAIGFTPKAVLSLVRIQMGQLMSKTPQNSAARAEWMKRWHALDDMPKPRI